MCKNVFPNSFLPDTSSIAAAMADHYGGLRLSIDAVVTDALINGTSPVSLKARELYDHAAVRQEEKRSIEAGEHETCGMFYIFCMFGIYTVCSRALTWQSCDGR